MLLAQSHKCGAVRSCQFIVGPTKKGRHRLRRAQSSRSLPLRLSPFRMFRVPRLREGKVSRLEAGIRWAVPTLIWNDLCQRVLFNFSSSFVYRGRPLVQAASTTNQSDMRGLVRHRRTRANSETFRREPGVLRTRIRPLSPPVAKGVSPMARIVPAPRIVFFSLSLILFLFRRRPQAITSSLPGSNGPLPLARRSGFGGGG